MNKKDLLGLATEAMIKDLEEENEQLIKDIESKENLINYLNKIMNESIEEINICIKSSCMTQSFSTLDGFEKNVNNALSWCKESFDSRVSTLGKFVEDIKNLINSTEKLIDLRKEQIGYNKGSILDLKKMMEKEG